MKGVNGVQAQVHPKFLELLHDWQNKRIAMGKDSKSGVNQLSTKRLSLTLCKFFKNDITAYNTILNAEILKNEE
jgi:hypothetical protein